MHPTLLHPMPRSRRRGAVVFLVLVLIPVLLGFAALTIDVGALYNTREDLQNAADAGSLAATAILAEDRTASGVALARQTAIDVINRHNALGSNLNIGPDDLVFGQIDYNDATNRYDFTPTESYPDSVRITVSKSSGSVNGPTSLFFAGIFGKRTANVQASAMAGLTGARDIAVVVDLSGSMKYDSELRFYRDIPTVNMRDVWASMDGPAPSATYLPVAEDLSEYSSDTGPSFGIMDTWGDPITSSYDPTTDPGLWYIPNNAPCTIGAITASLTARGYTAGQRNTIMNSSNSTTWPNRVAVMLGLAKWTPSGATDTTVGSTELTWSSYPALRKTWTWADYISWSTGSNNRLVQENAQFRYRFGVKTVTQYMLDRRYSFAESDLTQTPVEPFQSIKQGLQAMVDVTRPFDLMSLDVFATTARHELDLTEDRQSIADLLMSRQPNYYDPNTNIGGGLQLGLDELASSRARDEARPMIVLLSDGASNAGPDPISIAQIAVERKIPVYTISVGMGADRALMQEIAAMTGGQEFFAAGSSAEYTAELRQIFRTIGTIGFPTILE